MSIRRPPCKWSTRSSKPTRISIFSSSPAAATAAVNRRMPLGGGKISLCGTCSALSRGIREQVSMSRVGWFALMLLLLPAAGRPADPATHQIRLDGQTFTLPAGFTIERVAGPPLVDRPIVADFDDDGRLYVADSSGSNEKVEVQLQKCPH